MPQIFLAFFCFIVTLFPNAYLKTLTFPQYTVHFSRKSFGAIQYTFLTSSILNLHYIYLMLTFLPNLGIYSADRDQIDECNYPFTFLRRPLIEKHNGNIYIFFSYRTNSPWDCFGNGLGNGTHSSSTSSFSIRLHDTKLVS